MKAVIYTKYGSPDVLQHQEVEKPLPKDDQILVKIHTTSVNAADWLLLRGESILVRLMAGGLNQPKKEILGIDIAGRVEAVGSRVKKFKPGDEVYGDLSGCGMGGFAEYVAVPENALALKPASLTFEQAAAVPLAAVTALQGLRDKGRIQPGQKVLITGASGGVGTFAVQLARYFGADVTAVCSTSKMDMVRSIGANRVIDYTQEDVTKNGQQYDLILDIAAYRPFTDYKPILNRGGVYIVAGGSIGRLFRAMLLGPVASLTGGKTFGTLSAKPDPNDLVVMKELLEAGKVVPVIDRCYPLHETVEAFRYFGAGQARGKVVISVEGKGE